VTEELTPSQALLVWCLLAKQGVAKQKDIVPAVKKSDRETLARVKLVDVSKQGNSFVLRLEDNGWAWAAAHLGAEVPAAYQVCKPFSSAWANTFTTPT
jgi:hypothetical protein